MSRIYDASVFDVANVDEAKRIILTPENSTTEERWQVETRSPRDAILALSWSPDRKRIACAAGEKVVRIYETESVYLGAGGLSVEEVRDNWAKITDPEGQQAYQAGGEQSGKFFRKMQGG